MLMVVAPAFTAVWHTAITKSASERVASSGEYSMSSVCSRAWLTLVSTATMTSSSLILNLCSMWSGEVARNTWIRGSGA